MNKNCIASLLFILVVLTSTSTKSQSNYNVNLIPAELKSNARAVIRKDLKKLEVFTPERAVLTVQYAITVLNKNGIDDGIFKHPYNKFMKLNVKKAIVYDFNGEKLKKIPFGDMYDFSAIDNTTTFDDNRMKVIDPEIRDFPFTVEYEYELVFKGTLNLPSWRPYPDYEIAIEHSEMVIQAPEKPGFRYFERNIERNPNISKLGTGSIRSWSAENLKAVKEEPYSGPMTDFLPTVDFSMNSFSINGMPGDASSWNSFGKWIYDLNKGRDLLSVTTAEKITKLIEGSHSNADRIKIIYNYMQNNTRYVSVQVGIGGWQAFEAETVDRLSYGDCKALSNYMQSLLKSVGIESYYTLVYAGSFGSNIQKEFPSNQFNHVILCVPDRNDTLWLECTNQSIPFGYLGSFTDDRDVLLVKETGGEIVHTPVYTSEQNQKITKAQVTLYENGFGEVSVLTIHKGIFYDEARDILL
ncbi:MAG TPA: hypothetical protein DCY97_20760, partial [Marinilabiliales bacterium]|nr:hypothetical protein [Marinilabiliales bacterium]